MFVTDQVVTDMRLWLRDAITTLTDDALLLMSTMVERAAMCDTHTHGLPHLLKTVIAKLNFSRQLSLFFLGSEKLTCCFLVTHTCKGLSQSGGATGS